MSTFRKEGARLEALGQSSAHHRPLCRPGDGSRPGDLAPAPGGPEPTAGQFPFFLLLAAFEALTFGLGVSLLLFGFAPLKRALGGPARPVSVPSAQRHRAFGKPVGPRR